VVLHLNGYITPPYRDSVSTSTIYVVDSRPRRTRYRLLGSLTPEPLFGHDPFLPLHPAPTLVSVCILYYLTQMSLTRLMSTYTWCQKVLMFASAQPLPIIRKELSGRLNHKANCCRPDPYSDSTDPNTVYNYLPPHLSISTIPLKIAFLIIFSLLERDACVQCV